MALGRSCPFISNCLAPFLAGRSLVLFGLVLEDLCSLSYAAVSSCVCLRTLFSCSCSVFLFYPLLPLHCCSLILVKYLLSNVTFCSDGLFSKAIDLRHCLKFISRIIQPLWLSFSSTALHLVCLMGLLEASILLRLIMPLKIHSQF